MKGVLFGLERQCGKIEKGFVTLQHLANYLSFFLVLVTPFG